jgi:hypothetical protein
MSDLLYANGLGDAVIGVATRADGMRVVCYNVEKVLEILMKESCMTLGEAREFYEFNIVGAWMGELTPVFVEKREGSEEWNS